MKLLLSTAFAVTTATSLAQWTFVDLHDPVATNSVLRGTSKGISTGVFNQATTSARAMVWNGENWNDVTPPGAQAAALFKTTGSYHVGWAAANNSTVAGLWDGAQFNSLHPGSNYSSSVARGLDDYQQVGYATTGGAQHAMVWNGDANYYSDLHHPSSGFDHSIASDVFKFVQVGTVFGYSRHAALWRDYWFTFQDIHPAWYDASEALAIDEDTIVGGAYDATGNTLAMSWDAVSGTATSIHPWFADESLANDVHQGVAVGSYTEFPTGASRALIWFLNGGFTLDLSQFIPPGYSYSAGFAVYVDGGQITVVGIAHDLATGVNHAVMWVGS